MTATRPAPVLAAVGAMLLAAVLYAQAGATALLLPFAVATVPREAPSAALWRT